MSLCSLSWVEWIVYSNVSLLQMCNINHLCYHCQQNKQNEIKLFLQKYFFFQEAIMHCCLLCDVVNTHISLVVVSMIHLLIVLEH